MAEPESGQTSRTAPADEVVSSAKQQPPAQDGLPSISTLLATSRLGWTKAQQAAVREKLSSVGIHSFEDLAKSLNTVGHLNGLLRSHERTAFKEATLQTLRSLCLELQETSRMQQRWRLQKQKEDRAASSRPEADAEAAEEETGGQKVADGGEHADQSAGASSTGRRWGRTSSEARGAAAATGSAERTFMKQDELEALTKLLRGLASDDASQDEDASCQGAASDTEPSTTASVAEHAEHAAAPASSTSEEASSSGAAPQPMVLLKTGRLDRPAREKPVVIE